MFNFCRWRWLTKICLRRKFPNLRYKCTSGPDSKNLTLDFFKVQFLSWGTYHLCTFVGRFWKKCFQKHLLCSLYRSVLHWFVLYARNGLNEYGNTGSLVNVGHGLMQDKVKFTWQIWILLVSNRFFLFTRGKRKLWCGTIFEVHTFVTGFKRCCFHHAFPLV